jgi:transposase
MSRTRRRFTAEQKAVIVRRHLLGKAPVSDLADEFQVQPSQIHAWVKLVLDQAEAAFAKSAGKPRRSKAAEASQEQELARLQAKLAQKNEVISELMEENVRAKKANGEL